MRRFAAFLILACGTGLVLETSLTQADDDGNPPADDRVTRSDDGAAPAPGRGERGERREPGRRGRGGPRGERGPGGPGRQGPPPIMAALDVDKDGVISSSELEGAVAALKTLDRNGDGELTMDELRPERPGRGRPPGGEFGRRGGDFGPPRGEFEPRGGPEGVRGRGRERFRERPTPEQFVANMMKADEDGDGRISKDEAPERLQRGFDRIDADGSGFIEKSELEGAAKRFGERRGGGRRGEGGPGRRQRPEPDDTEV